MIFKYNTFYKIGTTIIFALSILLICAGTILLTSCLNQYLLSIIKSIKHAQVINPGWTEKLYSIYVQIILLGILFCCVGVILTFWGKIKNIIVKYPVHVAMGSILIYLLPYFIQGQNSNILIFDYLDSMDNYWLPAKDLNTFMNFTGIIPQKMSGFPCFLHKIVWNLQILPHHFLDLFAVHVFNQFLMHLVGFVGMYLLLRKHVLKEETTANRLIITGVSLAFALLPYFPDAGFKTAGMPLVAFSLLNIRDNQSKWYDWLIIFIVPYYSQYFGSYFFFLPIVFLLVAYDWIKTRKINFPLVAAFGMLVVVGLVSGYGLIRYVVFNPDFTPHRVEFKSNGLSFYDSLTYSIAHFFNGQVHHHSLHSPFILFSVLLAMFVGVWKKDRKLVKIIGCVALLAGFMSLFYGMNRWDGYQQLKESCFLLRTFQFSRFYSLFPLIWYVLFAIALAGIAKNIKRPSVSVRLITIIVVLQICFLFSYKPHLAQCTGWVDMVQIWKTADVEPGNPYISYKEYYSKDLFSEIRDYIGKPQESYRVASIGIHPSISLFNGFYTIDGYITVYPLEYKHKFRKVIEKELDKNQGIRKYFDEWGSRCYIFVDEITPEKMKNYPRLNNGIRKDCAIKIHNLELNAKALQALECQYILSAVEITNHEDNYLKYHRTFENDSSPWKIYLYEVVL